MCISVCKKKKKNKKWLLLLLLLISSLNGQKPLVNVDYYLLSMHRLLEYQRDECVHMETRKRYLASYRPCFLLLLLFFWTWGHIFCYCVWGPTTDANKRKRTSLEQPKKKTNSMAIYKSMASIHSVSSLISIRNCANSISTFTNRKIK